MEEKINTFREQVCNCRRNKGEIFATDFNIHNNKDFFLDQQ